MDDPGPVTLNLLSGIIRPLENGEIPGLIALGVTMIACLVVTGICAASENAFFSHRESDLEDLRASKQQSAKNILHLLSFPKHLLATILVLNSLGMVAFVVVSTIFNETIFLLEDKPWLRFFIDAIVVTLIILIFAELMPKVYATQHYRSSAKFLSYPMRAFMFLLWPFTGLLVKMSSFIERRIKQRTPELTPEELSHAIDMAADPADAQQEKDILKGIVNIAQIQVRQIMKPRMDIVGIDAVTSFHKLIDIVQEMRFSRMPVYQENLDNIIGILNIKHLLPHLSQSDDFDWKKLMSQPFFVPENKMIDDLLHEFRHNRNHLAVVVDEFGGTCGIVTLEDILEEVFGELNDEFDEIQEQYSRLDEHTYLFEGKIPLVDFLRITRLPIQFFDDAGDETETLGGFITELAGKIPGRGETYQYKNLVFAVDAADLRKVNRLKVTIHDNTEG
ncbi:MAG: gliding motility-associated protein GldE [Bacteroidetes bacterium]|jgi:gliding motility-associated protein GldE|nr:gliding motility-associated protein GldE [Bacteroidota bacterium]